MADIINNLKNRKMIKYYQVLLFLIAVSLSTNAKGYSHISGIIKSDRDKITHLQAVVFQNPLTAFISNSVVMDIPVNKNGQFSFSINISRGICRFKLVDTSSRAIFLPADNSFSSFQIAFPGDSVFLSITIKNGKKTINCTGRGSENYRAIRGSELELGNYNASAFQTVFNQLNNYIGAFRLSNRTKSKRFIDLILSDYISQKLDEYTLPAFDGSLFERFNDVPFQYDSLKQVNSMLLNEKVFTFFNSTFPEYNESTGFIKLMYRNLFLEYLSSEKSEKPVYENFYNFLREIQDDSTREGLICYFFQNGDAAAFFGAEPNVYKKTLANAKSLMKNSIYKGILTRIYSTRTKGASLTMPSLPRDSSKTMVNLSQFKGKVVLVDMWPYQCGGCAHFARAFHEGIFTKLKADTNFVVVSIMVDGKCKYDRYMRRLRGIGSAKEDGYDWKYTYPEYTTLYAGEGFEKEARFFENYWDIYRSPYTFLVGKDGNLYSATLPFFEKTTTKNCENLYSLIKAALLE